MDELVSILNVIPKIVVLILPGLVFIIVFNFICRRKYSDSWQSKFGIVVLSYLISLPFDYFDKLLGINSTIIMLIISVIFSVIFAILWATIYSSDWFNNRFLRKYLKINRTTRNQFFEDVFDYKNGMFVRIYLKDRPLVVWGVLISHSDSENERYFLIGNYSIHRIDGIKIDEEYSDHTKENNKRIIIDISNAYLIECEYSKDSSLVS
jgi:hypothetical protein